MIDWLKSRLGERSTLLGIGTAIVAASALPSPWNWISLAWGTIVALVPDKTYAGK